MTSLHKHIPGLIFCVLMSQSTFGDPLPTSFTGALNRDLPIVNGNGSLTVSGSNYWHRKVYGDGEQPSLSVYDSSGNTLADGHYTYDYRSIPATSDAAGLSRSRQDNVKISSGFFEVNDGQIVSK